MAKNVVLKHKDEKIWGLNVILPGVGEVKIDENGEFEVEEVVATQLLDGTEDYLLVEGNGTTVVEEDFESKLAKKKSEEETEDDEKESEEETEDDEEESEEEIDLSKKTLKELIEIAESAGIPEEEYAKFSKKKALMLNFLKKQL